MKQIKITNYKNSYKASVRGIKEVKYGDSYTHAYYKLKRYLSLEGYEVK